MRSWIWKEVWREWTFPFRVTCTVWCTVLYRPFRSKCHSYVTVDARVARTLCWQKNSGNMVENPQNKRKMSCSAFKCQLRIEKKKKKKGLNFAEYCHQRQYKLRRPLKLNTDIYSCNYVKTQWVQRRQERHRLLL